MDGEDFDGNFSEEEKIDQDFAEEQSLLNEINRHLDEKLSAKINYNEDTFTFSKRLENLANVNIPEPKAMKRDYQMIVEESVDNINK